MLAANRKWRNTRKTLVPHIARSHFASFRCRRAGLATILGFRIASRGGGGAAAAAALADDNSGILRGPGRGGFIYRCKRERAAGRIDGQIDG